MSKTPEQQLQQLFMLRDETYSKFTFAISQLITATTMMAIYDVLQLPAQNVTIHDVYQIDDMVIVAVTAVYDNVNSMPQAINEMGAYGDGEDDDNVRMIKVVLPIDMVFAEKSIIQGFIADRLNQQLEYQRVMVEQMEQEDVLITSNEFNWAELSEQQVQNLHKPKGSKH